MKEANLSKKRCLFVFLSALLILLVCSKCSPLYPLNDWVDANCFMTVGKSMLQGVVPYRDLAEQKGPLLYIIHAVASIISDTSFIGMYFFEVLFASIFLLLTGKILDLYQPTKASSAWLVLIASVTYSQKAFCHGNSAEEMCIPILTFALYVGLKAIKTDVLPSKKEFLLIGLTSGAMLWIKFSMLGFYIGWFLFFLGFALSKKALREFAGGILRICLGVFLISLPILLYFLINGAIADLFTGYFYNNIFAYTVGNNSSFSIFGTLFHYLGAIRYPTISHAPIICLLIAVGLVYFLVRKEFKNLLFMLLTLAGLIASVHSGKISYPYYALIFASFAPCGIIPLDRLSSFISGKINSKALFAFAISFVTVISVIFSYIASPNTYLLKYKKSDFPQYRFAKIIKATENPTLLNYGFLDGGFYLTADVIPTCKYFCKLNANLPEMTKAQSEVIDKASVDFVVTRDEQLSSPDYSLIDKSEFYYEGSYRTYYLYQKISE